VSEYDAKHTKKSTVLVPGRHGHANCFFLTLIECAGFTASWRNPTPSLNEITRLPSTCYVLADALRGRCATPYQPQSFRGFVETQLAPDMFKVVFKGNGYTALTEHRILQCLEPRIWCCRTALTISR
jgi:hypothetical protein